MRRRFLILAGIGAAVLCGLLPAAALAAEPAYTPAAERALGERWQAAAESYLGTSPSLSPEAIAALGARWQAMADRYAGEPAYTPAAVRALGERYEAMAEHYRRLELTELRSEASEFEWVDASLGALAALAAFGLAAGLGAAAYRHSHHPPASPLGH